MINDFFKFDENNTNLKTEIFAGLTTFLAMAYILGVNPVILVMPECLNQESFLQRHLYLLLHLF